MITSMPSALYDTNCNAIAVSVLKTERAYRKSFLLRRLGLRLPWSCENRTAWMRS